MYCVDLLEQDQSFRSARLLDRLVFPRAAEALRFFERHQALESGPPGSPIVVRFRIDGLPVAANTPSFVTTHDSLHLIRDNYRALYRSVLR